ncbi:MAG: hypothetical protein ACYDFT_07680 [Thermoplasmata archaeon]
MAETLWNEKAVLAEAANEARALLSPARAEKGRQSRPGVGVPRAEEKELEES